MKTTRPVKSNILEMDMNEDCQDFHEYTRYIQRYQRESPNHKRIPSHKIYMLNMAVGSPCSIVGLYIINQWQYPYICNNRFCNLERKSKCDCICVCIADPFEVYRQSSTRRSIKLA